MNNLFEQFDKKNENCINQNKIISRVKNSIHSTQHFRNLLDNLFRAHSKIFFLTLTHRDPLNFFCEADYLESQRRFRSIRAHKIKEICEAYAVVQEPQESGRIHYHLLLCGCVSERKIRQTLYPALTKYGFGLRYSLRLVREPAKTINYLCKYLSKNKLHLPGYRTWRVSQGDWKTVNSNFGYVRTKLRPLLEKWEKYIDQDLYFESWCYRQQVIRCLFDSPTPEKLNFELVYYKKF